MTLHDRLYQFRVLGLVENEHVAEIGASSVGRDGIMPAWFLRLCDIGLAISKLAEAERNAMNHRWKVAVDLDDTNRVVTIQGMRQTAMRRAGNSDEAKYHERAQARAQKKADALARELRKVDRHQVYRRAYQNLEAILKARKSPRP
jgi:hypothetical protein